MAWFLFYGRMFHMSREEILATRYGEMCDLIACYAISRGAKQRPNKRTSILDTLGVE